jgi:hypothetical protein
MERIEPHIMMNSVYLCRMWIMEQFYRAEKEAMSFLGWWQYDIPFYT